MGDDRDSDADELDRAAILRRRAVFVASAVAGLGLAASCGEASPAACLDIAPPPTAAEKGAGGAPEAPPQPCLDVAPAPCLEMPMPADAGVEAADAGPDGGPPPPTPQPCLRKAPPKPCLKMAPPKP